jgi:hypothetical protein
MIAGGFMKRITSLRQSGQDRGGSSEDRSPNDDRSDVNNPNNDAYDADQENREAQAERGW